MKNLLILLSDFGLWGTEKTAYIYMKKLKKFFNVSIASIFKWGERFSDFKGLSDNILVAEWDFNKLKEFILKNKIDIIYMHWVSRCRNPWNLIEFLSWIKDKHIRLVETSPFSIYTPETEKYLDCKLFVSKTSLLKFLLKYKNPSITHYDFIYNPLAPEILEQYSINKSQKEEERLKYWIGKDDFVIWKVWRADIVKRDDMIIDIVPLLKDKIKNLKIVVRSLPEFKLKKIEKFWIKDYFVLLPETVDEKEIAITYQLMDIMVHTSRIWESFWIALVEWMFFWLPVLTTDTDWSQWLLFDRDNSQHEILWDENKKFINNDKSLTVKIIMELYNNKSLIEEIWKKNKKIALRYTAENQLEKLINMLEWKYGENQFDINKEFELYKKWCIEEPFLYRLKYWIKWIYEMSFKKSFPLL